MIYLSYFLFIIFYFFFFFFRPFPEKPNAKIYGPRYDHKQGDELGRRQKRDHRRAAVVRPRVFDEKPPNAVRDGVQRKQRQTPFALVLEKQAEQPRREQEQKRRLVQLHGYDFLPTVFGEHFHAVPSRRDLAVTATREETAEPTESVRERDQATRDVGDVAEPFHRLAVLAKQLTAYKPYQKERARTEDKTAVKGHSRVRAELEHARFHKIVKRLKKHRAEIAERDRYDEPDDEYALERKGEPAFHAKLIGEDERDQYARRHQNIV